MTGLVRRRGARRRVVAALLLGAFLIAAPAAAGELLETGDPTLANPGPDPSIAFDDDLNNYVLFALDGINIKGSDEAGRGEIRGGNVGVNNPRFGERGVPRLRMCNGSGDGNTIRMDEGTQVVADTADLARACVLWDVKLGFCCNQSDPQAHTLTFGTWYPFGAPAPFLSNPVDGDTMLEAGELPVPIEQRGWSPCNASTTQAIGADRALSFRNPGVYGNVTMRGTVNLAPGVYTFCDLTLDRGAKLVMSSNTEVRVWGNYSMPRGEFGDPSSRDAKLLINGESVAFGRGGVVAAQLFAPNARVNLGNHTDVYGRLWAREFVSDWGININPDGPPTNSTTGPPTTEPPTTEPPTTEPPTTEPPTTEPPTTEPPTTEPPTTEPPTTEPPTTEPPTTEPPTSPPTLPPD